MRAEAALHHLLLRLQNTSTKLHSPMGGCALFRAVDDHLPRRVFWFHCLPEIALMPISNFFHATPAMATCPRPRSFQRVRCASRTSQSISESRVSGRVWGRLSFALSARSGSRARDYFGAMAWLNASHKFPPYGSNAV